MRNISSLETPKLLIDEIVLDRNIQWMQSKADRLNINLRPHVKTHKSSFIAAKQIQAGASGITVAKVGEAIKFINKGFKDIFVAYPVIHPQKITRLLRIAKTAQCKISIGVDSMVGIQSIINASGEVQYPLGVVLEIDTGYHRTGFSPENESLLLECCIEVQKSKFTTLEGIFSHCGHVYGAKSKKTVKGISHTDRQVMKKVKKVLSKTGHTVNTVSIGSTPSCLVEESFKGATEIRPGNYVLLDNLPLSLKMINPEQVALSILATVVSENEWYYFIDAGAKVLAADSTGHGPLITGHGKAFPLEKFLQSKESFELVKLSEEHGWIKKRKHHQLKIGQKVRIIPNHACTVMNLSDKFTLTKGDQVIKSYPIDARGATL